MGALYWSTVVPHSTHLSMQDGQQLLGGVSTHMREWVSTIGTTLSDLPRSLSDNVNYLSTNLMQYANDLGLPTFCAAPVHRDDDVPVSRCGLRAWGALHHLTLHRGSLTESLLSADHAEGRRDDGTVLTAPMAATTVHHRQRGSKKNE